MTRKQTTKTNPWIAFSDEDLPRIRQANRPVVRVYKHPRKWEVVIDLCNGLIGRNRCVFTNEGRLAVRGIMTGRRHKSNTIWEASYRSMNAHYSTEADAIAVASELVALAEKHLSTPMWTWDD